MDAWKGKYAHLIIVSLVVIGLLCAGCITQNPAVSGNSTPAAGRSGVLLIATTTSLDDTKLLDRVEDVYEEKYGVDLKITSQGTGKAIELAKRGDVDLLLVHSPSQEQEFIQDGYGVNPRCFAYNYFMIIGPAGDPANIRGLSPEEAFAQLIASGKNGTPGVQFVSRGDNSGTHSAEKNLWRLAGFDYAADVQNSGPWYIESGRGMGETLTITNEKGAYTLTDEGTYLSFQGQMRAVPLITTGDALLNRYSAIIVNPVRHPTVNYDEADRFIDWLTSDEGVELVGSFGKDMYNKSLFTPLLPDVCASAPFQCNCSG